MNQGAQVV